MAFAAEGGAVDDHGVAVTVDLAPGASRQVRFFIAWHYPSFTLPRGGGGPYLRRYTEDFADAAAVIRKARARADAWSAAIDRWHDAFQVPPEFHRLWFSSLSSVICSTMLGTHRQFFEIETPHDYVNTMDVCAYSNWLYLVNWPEIERMDMDMFFSAIPTDGPQKGFVWHSLWQDPADYVEEPTFLVRLWRDHRWFNDRAWLATGFPHAVNAANRVYATAGQEALIKSPHGNQSYDLWKMPGIGSYVNSAWIYGLWSLERMTEALGQPATVGGTPVADLRRQAVANFDRILWNETTGAWDCFAKAYAPDATSVHDSLFTDQLFGRWMCLLDPRVDEVLPPAKVQRSLATLYRHNLLVDEAAGFRGWTNGRLPSGKADTSGTHAQTAWICAQTDLGSLLGASGDEAASLDVFRSVEGSLKQNHLAVGEWNRAITADGRADIASEPGKDTPRFAPYPRYKCTWEYLVRMLGLTMDDQAFTVAPFHTIPIGLTDVRLAGTSWTIRVAPGWTRALVDGQPVALPVTIPRTRDQVRVEFLP